MIFVFDRQSKKLQKAELYTVLVLPFCHTTLSLEQMFEAYPHLYKIEKLVLDDYYKLEWRDGHIANATFNNKDDEMEFGDILGEDLYTINVGTTQEIELSRIKELKKEKKMEKRLRRQTVSV